MEWGSFLGITYSEKVTAPYNYKEMTNNSKDTKHEREPGLQIELIVITYA